MADGSPDRQYGICGSGPSGSSVEWNSEDVSYVGASPRENAAPDAAGHVDSDCQSGCAAPRYETGAGGV